MAVRGQRLTRTAALPSILRIWHGLRSMTFAIIMLTVILLTVVVGSFLPQDNGIRLVYESPWFYALNFLLMASVLSCISRRARPVFRYAFRVPVVHRPEFYRATDTATALDSPVPAPHAARAVAKALRAAHYRVEVQERDGRTFVLADRFRAMRLGTLISHLSIVLMVATIAWGSLAGWLDKNVFVEAGGTAVPLGHGTGLSVRSDSFDFGFYPNGLPRNFNDQLSVIEANGTTHHQLIDVNTPWYYGGMFGYDIHQASYGVTARLIAIDTRQAHPTPLNYCVLEDGAEDCSSFVPLIMAPLGDGSYRAIGNGLSAFYIPSRNLAVTLTVHDPVPNAKLPMTAVITVAQPPRKTGDTMRILREQADVPIGTQRFNGQPEHITAEPINVGGIRFALLIRRMAGLNIGHNPAVPFIFISFALILLGLVSVLYFPFSRLWVYVAPSDEPAIGSIVLLRGSAEKSRQSFKRRFDLLTRAVQRELQMAGTTSSTEGVRT